MRNIKQVTLALCAASLLLATVLPAAPPPQAEPGGPIASPLVSPDPPEWEDRSSSKVALGEAFEAAEVRRIVADLSPAAAAGEVELALYELMPQVYRATQQDLPVIGEALASLRQQPGAVEALASHYWQMPAEAYEKRLMVLGILGELRRADAAAPLHEMVWATLPAAESISEGLSDRDLEEMMQAKAIQGLAYLKSAVSDEAVRDVIVNHESLHVRVSAIDAYMWNHGDRRETAAELYDLLPVEMHMYVERPRFRRGMDPEKFNQSVASWRDKYGVDPEPTPELDARDKGDAK